MCFGGSPKTPDPVPAPAPAPVPTPEQSSPSANNDARQSMLQKMRFGLASTVKTSPRGITGSGPDLQPSGLYNAPGKTKLGV